MPPRVFGHIAGYVEGSLFDSRRKLSEIGIHRPTMAGISGTPHEGADSIVVSGGSNASSYLGDYIGLSLKDAINRAQTSSFTPLAVQLGKPLCVTEADSMSRTVIRQRPTYEQGLKLKMGAPVELYFSCDSTYKEPAPIK